MTDELKKKLEQLPKTPGVYLYHNKKGQIIYVGKAAVLRNRVRQYFQKSRLRDPKTDALISEITTVDWIEVETELDALFLEAELIRRYLPQYNILLRDDKSLSYIRISITDAHPTLSLTRQPLDDGAQYFGPYYQPFVIKRALRFLRKVFPFDWRIPDAAGRKRASLDYHLRLSPGLEFGKTSLEDYRQNLRQLMRYLRGERTMLIKELEKQMKIAAAAQAFEEAAILRNRLRAIDTLKRQIVFSDREFMDLSKDEGLSDLTSILGLTLPPRRIEGYDISHMSGTDTVASMVVFTNGLPDKQSYRKFKMRIPGNDDFAHMNEVITRRLSEKNIKQWGVPDLFLIDGGKGQLGAAVKALAAAGSTVPAVGLAKQFEQIVIKKATDLERGSLVELQAAELYRLQGVVIEDSVDFIVLQLPKTAHSIKLLQRIRDESHRFAVSYHTVLKRTRQTSSVIDDIPTIGPATKKKLLKTFGSLRGLRHARKEELIRLVGEKKATIIRQYLPKP